MENKSKFVSRFAKKWETSSSSNDFWLKVQGRLQKFGGYLSGMIIPVIGVIIAWGFLTMFFIEKAFNGATSVPEIAVLVGPIINYVVPVLVGFMAGKLFFDIRGGVLGAFVTAGAIFGAAWWVRGDGAPQTAPLVFGDYFGYKIVIVDNLPVQKFGSAPNMLMGAMICGSFSAIGFKHLEKLWAKRIPTGYEMLVNNYSLAIFAFAAILVAMFGITPVIIFLMLGLAKAVEGIEGINGLPLLSILIEPAKPLFLNNAIGNGTLVPVGLNQAQTSGKSALFFAEANPGPGFGMLLAFLAFGNKREKTQAGASLPVHFIGGIHEVYFPFVLSNYLLVFPLIISGAVGMAAMQAFSAGLTVQMSPGSIIAAYLSVNKTGLDIAGMSIGIFGSAVVSFLGSWAYLKLWKKRGNFADGVDNLTKLKGRESKYIDASLGAVAAKPVALINVACDQGTGSSAIGASTLRNALTKKQMTDVKVINTAIKDLNKDADVVVVSRGFESLVKKYVLPTSKLFIVDNLVGAMNFEKVVDYVKSCEGAKANAQQMQGVTAPVQAATVQVASAASVPATKKVSLHFISAQVGFGHSSKSVTEAIVHAGDMLAKNKFVSKEYIEGMKKRNADVSVAIGNGLAIPHGRHEDIKFIKKAGLSLTLYPKGIMWDEKMVYVVIGIAAQENEHMDWIQAISLAFEDESFAKKLASAKTVATVNRMFKERDVIN